MAKEKQLDLAPRRLSALSWPRRLNRGARYNGFELGEGGAACCLCKNLSPAAHCTGKRSPRHLDHAGNHLRLGMVNDRSCSDPSMPKNQADEDPCHEAYKARGRQHQGQ
jgi:hypothetical protein